MQERSRASTERMIAAATALFLAGGYEAVTASEVARGAGVAVGTIYGRFGNKDGLVKAVQAGLLAQIETAIDALGTSPGWPGAADGVLGVSDWIAALAALLDAHASDLQPIMQHAAIDPSTAEMGRGSYEHLYETFVAALADGREGAASVRGREACGHCFVIAYASFARALGLGTSPDAADRASLPTLTRVLGDMCEAYLAKAC